MFKAIKQYLSVSDLAVNEEDPKWDGVESSEAPVYRTAYMLHIPALLHEQQLFRESLPNL